MGKLINRIPGLRLLISSLPGSDLRTLVESLGKPRDSTSVLKALPGKLDIKRHSPSILYLSDCMYLYQVNMTLHFLNDVINDIASTWKLIIC